jgi:hypothetical protein
VDELSSAIRFGRWTELARLPVRTLGLAIRSATRPWREASRPEIPTQRILPTLLPSMFLDELLFALGRVVLPERPFDHDDLSRARQELDEALAILEANDCFEDPALFHLSPPPIEDVVVENGRLGPVRFERLAFDSDYQPLAGVPGAGRWHAMETNSRAWAYLLRHRDGPRPWVVNLHPFTGGTPLDLVYLRALHLHRTLGFNVLHPVFPLHGRRRPSPVHPRCEILSFDFVNTIHFVAQSIWDVRRLLGWVRAEGATSISVHGVSLGAYVAALLAAVEHLDRVILGIGAADLLAAMEFRFSEGERQTLEEYGLAGPPVEALHRVISPLALGCVVPRERRFMYAGVGDRFAPGGMYQMWQHWEQPDIHWYPGGHIVGIGFPSVWRYVYDVLTREIAS